MLKKYFFLISSCPTIVFLPPRSLGVVTQYGESEDKILTVAGKNGAMLLPVLQDVIIYPLLRHWARSFLKS